MSSTTNAGTYLYKHPEIKTPYPMSRIERKHPDYKARIGKMPLAPPPHMPGDLVFDAFHGANVPLLLVSWDRSLPGDGSISGWRGHTPGHGDKLSNFSVARADKPTWCYKQVGYCSWRKVGGIGPALGMREVAETQPA